MGSEAVRVHVCACVRECMMDLEVCGDGDRLSVGSALQHQQPCAPHVPAKRVGCVFVAMMAEV